MRTNSGRSKPTHSSVIASLRFCTGMADAQLCCGLAERAGCAVPSAHLLRVWDSGDVAMPEWVERCCAEWILELWQRERATCDARQLLGIDQKYTGLLRDYSVADLMAVLRRVTPHFAV